MTTVLQFTSTNPTAIAKTQGAMLALANTGSMLAYRAQNDAGYVTQPFGSGVWQTKANDATTFWCDWGAIYAQLGVIGQQQADLLIGSAAAPGIFLQAPLGTDQVQMTLVSVPDLVAGGYVAGSTGATGATGSTGVTGP